MTEKQIESRLVRMVKERGGLTYKFTSPNNPGVPDRIIITPAGAVHFVELKTLVGSLQRIQKWQISEMQKRGASVCVLRGWEQVREFIDRVIPS